MKTKLVTQNLCNAIRTLRVERKSDVKTIAGACKLSQSTVRNVMASNYDLGMYSDLANLRLKTLNEKGFFEGGLIRSVKRIFGSKSLKKGKSQNESK